MRIQKWEYAMTYLKFENNSKVIARLNEMGKAGWELIMKQGDYGIYKRPFKPERRGLK